MSGTKFLLDTNVILYLLAGDETIAELINGKQLYISFISELELLGYSDITELEQDKIKEFLKECTVINITQKIKDHTIKIRQNFKVKLPDGIIAATSKFLNIPLITSDSDFRKIEEIDTIIYEY